MTMDARTANEMALVAQALEILQSERERAEIATANLRDATAKFAGVVAELKKVAAEMRGSLVGDSEPKLTPIQ
jgi:hypothetical protein